MMVITQVSQEKNVKVDALCDLLVLPRATYYRHQHDREIKPVSPSHAKPPKNALSGKEKQHVLDILHSERFIDRTPYEAFNALIDAGEYCCSARTMYRVLESQEETLDRRQQRNHRDAVKPELLATKPNEV
jgi:hypothetical protein